MTDGREQLRFSQLNLPGTVRKREIKLGEILSALLRESSYSRSRKKVAEAVGVSPAALSQYIHGQASPSMRVLVALADFFGVTLDYLVFGQAAAIPVDYAPLARYVDHALAGVQEKASRRAALVSQVGRMLGQRIDEVAEQLTAVGGAPAGFIHDNDLLLLERYSLQTDLISLNLQHDLITVDGAGDAAGRFLPVVATNLGLDRPYRFLLPRTSTRPQSLVARFREGLSSLVGGDKVWSRCQFRQATHPITNGIGSYRLDIDALIAEEPALHLQVAPYLDDLGCFGYVMTSNADSHGDLIMDPDHLHNALTAFEQLWATGEAL